MAWREASLEVKKLCYHVSLDVVVIICAVGEDQKNVGIDWSRLSCAARHLQFACLSVVPSFSPPFASATKPLLGIIPAGIASLICVVFISWNCSWAKSKVTERSC